MVNVMKTKTFLNMKKNMNIVRGQIGDKLVSHFFVTVAWVALKRVRFGSRKKKLRPRSALVRRPPSSADSRPPRPTMSGIDHGFGSFWSVRLIVARCFVEIAI